MGHSFWPSSFESPKEQRNLTKWVTGMEGLLGEPASNPKANSCGDVKTTCSSPSGEKAGRHGDTNTIFHSKEFF